MYAASSISRDIPNHANSGVVQLGGLLCRPRRRRMGREALVSAALLSSLAFSSMQRSLPFLRFK
ncbi:hypothetical protein IVA79_31245 [Bradyrhizobium sp. 138]|nr:hypothetical protein [Bradyrhizobium sp. 138]